MSVEWIREGLKKPGKSQAGLARALGKDPSAMSRLMSGERQLKASELEIVREYLAGTAPKSSQRPSQSVTNTGPEDMLRVLGMAEGGPDGWNLWNGDTVEYIPRPANLLGNYIFDSPIIPG